MLTHSNTWPALPLESWRETYATLHMWTQVVGKICLALTPPSNHFWNIAFRITPQGFATPLLYARGCTLTMTFDFIEHQLAHAVRDPLGRAYNRTSHLKERRKMMRSWADYLDSLRLA